MSINIDLGGACVKTTISIDPTEVDECIQAMMSNPRNHKRLIGLDIIRCPNPSSRIASVDLIQLCDESQCVIFKLSAFCVIPNSLYNILSWPAFTFVGFEIKSALDLLRMEYGFVCKNYLEAGYFEIRRSLTSEYPAVRTIHISPTHFNSNSWDAKGNLPEDLINLAVSNAHFAFRIGRSLLN